MHVFTWIGAASRRPSFFHSPHGPVARRWLSGQATWGL